MASRILTRRRAVLVAPETTYGVDPVPTAALNAILTKNLTQTPMDATIVKRDVIQPWMGNSGVLLAEIHNTIAFEVELAGSGTAGTAPAWGALLLACAFSQTIVAATSVTYQPVSSALGSVTIYYHLDGQLHKMTGCRGEVEIALASKTIATLKFTMTGIYADPTAVAVPPAPVFTTQATPVIPGSTTMAALNVFGYSGAVLEKYDLKIGNVVSFVNRVGTNGQFIYLTDRMPSGSVDIEAPTVDVIDFFALAAARTNGAISFTLGTVAGNKVQVNCPVCNINNPSLADTSGVQMMTIPFEPQPVAGNDELTIVVT